MQPSRQPPQEGRDADERRRLQALRNLGPAAAAAAVAMTQQQSHDRIPVVDSLPLQASISPYDNSSSFLPVLSLLLLGKQQQERRQQQQYQQQVQHQRQHLHQLQHQRQLRLQNQLSNVGIFSPTRAVGNHPLGFVSTKTSEPNPPYASATAASRGDALEESKREAAEIERKRRLIKDPMPNDVLFGRGRPLQAHPGNLRFHRIVNKYREAYKNARKDDKSTVTATVLAEISTLDAVVATNKKRDKTKKDTVKDPEEQRRGKQGGTLDYEKGDVKDLKTGDASTRTADLTQHKSRDQDKPCASQDSREQDADHEIRPTPDERIPPPAKLQGGRFLRRTESGNHWMEVSTSEAMEKTSHALRGFPRRSELGRSTGSFDTTIAAPDIANNRGGGEESGSITAVGSTTLSPAYFAVNQSCQNVPKRKAIASPFSSFPPGNKKGKKQRPLSQSPSQHGVPSSKIKAPTERGSASFTLPSDVSSTTSTAADPAIGLSTPMPALISGIASAQPGQDVLLGALRHQQQQLRQHIQTYLVSQQQQNREQQRHALIDRSRQDLERQVLIGTMTQQLLQQEQSLLQSRREQEQQRQIHQQHEHLILQLLQQQPSIQLLLRQQLQNPPASLSQGLQLLLQQHQQHHQQQQQPQRVSQLLSQPYVASDGVLASMLRDSQQDTSAELLVRQQLQDSLRRPWPLRDVMHVAGMLYAQGGNAPEQDNEKGGVEKRRREV